MVVVANVAAGCIQAIIGDGSNKNEINVILLTEGYYINKYSWFDKCASLLQHCLDGTNIVEIGHPTV
jgi:hypothetical protein